MIATKRTDREGPIHKSIVQWLRVVLPEALTATVKNEINKGGSAFAIEQAKAKARGVVTGFPDVICLPGVEFPTMFFEVKAEGEYARATQKEVHAKLASLGYRVAVVRSIEDVRERLLDWGVPIREAGSPVKLPLRGRVG